MSKDERVANAMRVLTGELVRPIQTFWWHAYGRVIEFPRTDGKDPDRVHQLSVIGRATSGPDEAREMNVETWGEYLGSWDHDPTLREKEAVTPAEFQQSEQELLQWEALEPFDDGSDDQW